MKYLKLFESFTTPDDIVNELKDICLDLNDNYVDVNDGEDGPVPNEAMILMNEMACAYYDCDEYDLIGVNWLDKETTK